MADTKISGLAAATNAALSDLFAVDQAGASASETWVQVVGGYVARQHASYTLTSTASVQKLFNVSANGAVTLPIGSYIFHSLFSLSGMSTSSGNAAFSFAVSGAVITNLLMDCIGIDGATATAATRTGSTAVTSAFPASMVTAGAAATMQCSVNGSFEITTAGSVIPSIQLVTAIAAVVAIGSYIRIVPMGPAATSVTLGPWT